MPANGQDQSSAIARRILGRVVAARARMLNKPAAPVRNSLRDAIATSLRGRFDRHLCHAAGNPERLSDRAGIRDSFTRNIKRRSVGWSGNWNRESAGYGDAAIKPEQLKSDLALIVVHRNYSVVIAPPRGYEQSVGRQRADDVRTRSPGTLDGRTDRTDLLGPKEAALSGMRVQGGDRDPGLGDSGAGEHEVKQVDGCADLFDS